MDLYRLTSGVIDAVNPRIVVSIQTSAGNVTNPDGTVAPLYDPAVSVLAQVQALSGRDLRQIEGLNLQGTLRAIYVDDGIDGVERVTLKGGDLITLPDCSVWLVTLVPEPWKTTAGWTKAIITLQVSKTQMPPPPPPPEYVTVYVSETGEAVYISEDSG